MDYNFFDYTLNFNWDMVPIDRSFDVNKVQGYLSLLTEPDFSFVKDVLNKTTYVNYLEFKQALNQSFELFRKTARDEQFYLLLPTDKIGSEHWLTALLWPQLRTMNCCQIINETPQLPLQNGIHNILIIDDAFYTGTNTYNKIDNLIFTLSEVLNIDNNNEAGKYFNFHLVIPFMSTEGKKFLTDECNFRHTQCNFYGIHYLPVLKELLDISKYYPENSEQILRDRFEISLKLELPIADMPAIYFDHKVAAPESTFSSIYLQGKIPNIDLAQLYEYKDGNYGSLFKVNPSREKIDELAGLFINFTISKH
jgi:hypothetical protein